MKTGLKTVSGWLALGTSCVLLIIGVQACAGGNNGGGSNASSSSNSPSSAALSPAVKQAWYSGCLVQGGEMVSIGNVQACRLQFFAQGTMQAIPFPILTLETPQNPTAQVSQIQLYAGDSVVFEARGNQGVLGFFNCTGPDVDGNQGDEQIQGADGQPAGLYGILQFVRDAPAPS